MMIILDHYNGNDNENGNDNGDEEKKETRYMRNKGGLKKKIKKNGGKYLSSGKSAILKTVVRKMVSKNKSDWFSPQGWNCSDTLSSLPLQIHSFTSLFKISIA